MKVYVISKNSDSLEGRGYNTPVAVTLDNRGVQFPYSAEEFVVIATSGQPDAIKAFKEASRLSEETKREFGITFNTLANLQKLAEPNLDIKAGSNVYLSFYNGEDGMASTRVTGVYTWERKDDPFERPVAFRVAQDISDYLDAEKKQKIQKEVASLSPETKRLLGMKF